MKTKYHFNVPDQKRVRMIVHTDCKNEADDQYALVHRLHLAFHARCRTGAKVPSFRASTNQAPWLAAYAKCHCIF